MKDDSLTQTPARLASCWQDSAWYAALSLSERVALLRASNASITRPDSTRALKLLQKWNMQRPFDQGTFFVDRLVTDAITQDDLLFLLAEPTDDIQSHYLRASGTPDWLIALNDAFEHYRTGEADDLLQELINSRPLFLYLQPLLPLLRRACCQIQEGIQALSQRYAMLPFEPQQIIRTLLTSLPERLLAQISKTFVLEMHIARLQQRLQGESPEERFKSFVQQLSQGDEIITLLKEYPVLTRHLLLTISQWTDYAQEFLTHMCADWREIRTLFTSEQDPGQLTEVHSGSGDIHRQGRSVLTLTFSSGLRLLYKPKPLAVDAHFQELLHWLNSHGAQPDFRTLKILDRGNYGWVEFVHAQSCTSSREVARFYERQGSYLALLYALNAIDIHGENLIAAGEHPVLVDLEALFHPYISGNDPTQPYYLGVLSMDRSVFRVGLLPHRIWSNDEAIGVDLSGLGGQEGQISPHRMPTWEAIATDEMRLTRQRIEITGKQNRPKLNGHEVDVLDYRHHITKGFITMYRFLQVQRDALIAEVLPIFAQDEVRLLLRPTQRYATLLRESFHPDLLRNALKRDCFFDHIWREVSIQPYLTRVIAAERRDLLQGDLPVFTTYPTSRTIFTSRGEAINDFFDSPGLMLVEQRLQELDEQDLARQTWIIEAAMATLLMNPGHTTGKTLQRQPGHPASITVSRENLITAASAVGERLYKLALRDNRQACWLGVSPVNDQAWSLLPTSIDLYNGNSGIALFLAYLGTVTGQERYTVLARSALETVYAQIAQQKKDTQAIRIGAFDGIGSAIYLLTHLSVLWHEPALLHEAEALVELLLEHIPNDEQFDIISGSAGCILSLLSLYTVHPVSRTLAVAQRCGERLLDTAQTMKIGSAWTTIKHEKPLGGFAHGTAGIALSLYKLAVASGDERYQQAARAALAYDRSLFLPEQQNWADLRTLPTILAKTQRKKQGIVQAPEQTACMVGWCHGAAGIGLGRLAMLSLLPDKNIHEGKRYQEIEIALRTTLEKGMSENHSLCHGAFGNLDLLLLATQILNNAQHRASLELITAKMLESIDTDGWVTGAPLGIETPGFMIGLAGIGYQLLRLAEPEKVPSVLLLMPPALP